MIYFDRESPLLTIALDRKQLLSYDVSLLDVPGQRNTIMNIMLKNYSIRRVAEIKAHNKQLVPTITFADIWEKCRLENASRKTKLDARNTLIAFFKHLQEEGYIKSFEITKKGNAFYAIKFS